MRKHVALVAEQAFWDSVEAGLDGRGDGSAVGGGASPRSSSCVAERLAVLLAELGQEVIKVLPEQGAGKALAEELSASFSVPELLKVLTGNAQRCPPLAASTDSPALREVSCTLCRMDHSPIGSCSSPSKLAVSCHERVPSSL